MTVEKKPLLAVLLAVMGSLPHGGKFSYMASAVVRVMFALLVASSWSRRRSAAT